MTALAYQLVMAGLRLISPFRKEKPVPNYYPGWGEDDEPQPRALYCDQCARYQVFEVYRWVIESVVDYECTKCGWIAA